ncbi:YlbF family regulator [Macrococcus caseolyticus]|nr:YlbF family regulator [Macrococcus caseolyticus]
MYDNEVLTIIDEAATLNQMILESHAYLEYKSAVIEAEQNKEVQQLKNNLLKIKEKYDEVSRFGRYHPDYQTVMLQTRHTKKLYDMHPVVARMKQLETNLQTMLDEVMVLIAHQVSTEVKVEKGNPFFETQTCSSGCGCS